MKARVLAVVVLLAGATLVGCSDVVDGTGSEGTAASRSGGFPSGSTGPSDSTGPTGSTGPTDTGGPSPTGTTSDPGSPDFTCPDITYSGAHMTFNCLSNAMRVHTGGSVYEITMAQSVEPATGWAMEMGAERYEGAATSFTAISSDIRGDLLDSGAYGTSPTYDIDSVDYSTISGHRAYTTIDTVTLNPAWAKTRKTTVKQEKRYLVIIELGPNEWTMWFASIPDLAKQYWAQVPAAIASIKINA